MSIMQMLLAVAGFKTLDSGLVGFPSEVSPAAVGYSAVGSVGTYTGSGSIKGNSLDWLESLPTGNAFPADFQIAINGILTQTLFDHLTVEDSTGVIRTYTAASATFVGSSSPSTWSWGNGSNPVWPYSYAGANRQFAIFG